MNKHASLIIALTGLMICSMNFTVLSQAPPFFKYQAVVRDKTGQVLASQDISLQVSILQSTTDGPEVYREVHSVTTSELGLVTIEVGRGKSLIGSMAAIDWGGGSHFLRIEMDPSGGTNFELMGISELLSVPYALYAEKSGSGEREADLDWEVIGNDVVTGHGGSYPGGNVGIGNNAPGTLLYVAKNMGEPTITIRNLGGGGGATYAMVDDLSGADWKFKATTYGGFKIRDHANLMDVLVIEPNSAANSIYIKSGGNVGIGTTNPVTKLDVNGGVKMNGSVVMTGITPGGSSDSLILALNPVTNQLYYKYASNLGGGGAGGGESNTASNLGTGIGVYEQKSGVDLQFNSLKSTNSILDIAEDDPDDVINFTLHQSHINHNGLLNYVPQQHFYQKSIDTVALYHNGLLAATNGVLSDITNNSSDWNAAYGWGDHAAMGYLINEMDGDPANELQVLTRAGNTIALSHGGGAVSVDDADADPGNEIQNLAVNGDQLSISAGNTVILPGDHWGSQTVITDATLTGDGTPANALHIAPQGAAPGQVLSWNGTTWTPSSAAFNGWSLTGNAGTNPADHFIGTIDNQPLIFRVSDYPAGIIDPVNNLVALGPGALLANTTGDGNAAFGAYALYSNKANSRSTAVGALAMYYADERTIGRPTYNTAVGYEALKGSSVATDNSGQFNTAVGDRTLVSNTSGNYNAANGCHSLYNNASGSYNTASGSHSLYTNTSGNYNTASGNLSLHLNTSGDANTATGEFSLFSNTTGDENTAMGSKAGYSNSTGSGNVFLGHEAGYNETGNNKLYISNSSTNPPLIYGDFSTGGVSFGTITPHSSAKLEVNSTTQGFLPPRMTSAQRTAITSPTAGLLVFQTDAPAGYYYYTGISWVGLEGSGAGAISSSSCIDYDGNAYPTITIGMQVWMAENLRVTHYRNGDAIPDVTDGSAWSALTTGAYCWYDNDENENEKYGTLYNWYAVDDSRGLCPTGWHVPTDGELTAFTTYLGGEDVAGGKMKSVNDLWISTNYDATNLSGFSGLPGGYRLEFDGDFFLNGLVGYVWSSTQYDADKAWYRYLAYDGASVHRYSIFKERGFSVRCLRD